MKKQNSTNVRQNSANVRQNSANVRQNSTTVKRTPRKTKIQELLEKAGKLTQEEIKEIFERFDYNGNGILSLAEIDKAIAETYPLLAKDKPALMRAYKAADASEDGFIELNEFGRLLDLLYYYNDVYKKFKKLDKNNDKRINYEEFKEGYKIIGIKVASEKELKAEFNKIDANGGGYILFDEFCLFVSQKKQHDDVEAEKAELAESAENVENAEKPIEQ